MSTPLTIHTVTDPEIIQISTTHPSVAIKLEQKSGELIEQFFNLDMKDVRALQQHSLAIRELGLGVQKQLAKRSHLLKQPLAKLVAESDAGSISHSLIALQEQTHKINPNKIDFNMSGLIWALI